MSSALRKERAWKTSVRVFSPAKKVMETSDEMKAFCIGAGKSVAVGENKGPKFLAAGV